MLNRKYLPNNFKSWFGLVMVLNLILLGLANPANAERRQRKTRSLDFGLPTHRRDGGTRGGCASNTESQKLVALIPQENVGINASISPKLFFYVPKVEDKSTLEFVMRNEEDNLMYEAFLLTEGSGIMSIEVPAEVTSKMLKEDENYHWYLSMICDAEQRSRDIVVEGWMRQETIDVATQKELKAATVVEKAEVYREQGFWFDALSVLAENSDSLKEQSTIHQKWSEMLSSVGLKNLAAEPFIEAQLVENPTK